VPCGNFGNLISGLYAWKFGMPVNGFIAAMNKNNSFGEYISGSPLDQNLLFVQILRLWMSAYLQIMSAWLSFIMKLLLLCATWYIPRQ